MPKDSKVKNIARLVIIMSMRILVCCKTGIYELFQEYKPIALGSSSLMSGRIRKEDFDKKFEGAVFIRNLPSTEENSSASNDTIVMKSKIDTYTLERSLVTFVHLAPKSFSASLDKNSDVDRKDKKENIFVVPFEMHDRKHQIKKLEELKDIETIENEAERLESALQFIIGSIPISIFNKYINHINIFRKNIRNEINSFCYLLKDIISTDSNSLEPIFKSNFAYNIAVKKIFLKKRYNYQDLLYMLQSCKKSLNSILEERNIVSNGDIYGVDGIEEIDKIFNEDTMKIGEQIRYSEGRCSKIQDLEVLMREIVKDTIMCINILTSGKFPFLIEDALYEEEEIEGSEEKTKIRIKPDVKSKMKEELKTWDVGLLELLCKKIEAVYNFNGTIKGLKEMEKKDRKNILDELENRRVKAYRAYKSYLALLVDKYERKIRSIEELLDEVQKSILENEEYNEFDKREMIIEEEKRIRPRIISMLASCISLSDEEKAIEYVNSMLISIAEEYAVCGEVDYDQIKKKREELIDSILGVFVFNEKNRDKYIDDTLMVRNSIREFLDKIISILIAKEIEDSASRKYKLAKEEIGRNLRSSDWDAHISFIMECFNKYYDPIIGTSFSYKVDRFELRKYKIREEYIAKDMRKAIKNQTMRKWIENNIQEGNIEEINRFLKSIQIIQECRSMINTHTKIWKSSIYLTIALVENSNNFKSSKISRVLIKYKEKGNREIVKKEVEFTDESLEAFRSAKTLDDIRKIEEIPSRRRKGPMYSFSPWIQKSVGLERCSCIYYGFSE